MVEQELDVVTCLPNLDTMLCQRHAGMTTNAIMPATLV
jgi:hypothetical protein